MGQLRSTGVFREGHKTDFKYFTSNAGRDVCDLVCECGWNTWIESYGQPHCVIEIQVKYNDHLIDCGLEPLNGQHTPRREY